MYATNSRRVAFVAIELGPSNPSPTSTQAIQAIITNIQLGNEAVDLCANAFVQFPCLSMYTVLPSVQVLLGYHDELIFGWLIRFET